MATLTELQAYKGDIGLGQGSNADISVTNPNNNLNILNDAISDLKNKNYETNLRLFNQKIADRETLRKLIADGQVQAGEIDPQYRPIFDAADKRVRDALSNIKGDNDEKGIENYMSAVRDLKDVAAHAQLNTLGLKQLQSEKAAQPLAYQQDLIQKHIDNQKNNTAKDFWQSISPYQKMYDWDVNKINAYKANTSSVQNATQENPYDITTTYADYEQTRRNALNDYLNPNGEGAENMRQFANAIQSYTPQQLRSFVNGLNTQIDKANAQISAINPNAKPVEHVKATVLNAGTPNEQIAIQEQIPDLAAKYAFANQDKFVTQQSQFNDKLGKYNTDLMKAGIDREKLGVAWYNAETARKRQKIYEAWRNFQMGDNDQTLVNNFNSLSNYIQPNAISKRNLVIDNKTGAIKSATPTGETYDVIAIDDIPMGYKMIGGVTYDDKAKKVIPVELHGHKAANGKYYYYVDYFDGNGNKINKKSQSVVSDYNASLKSGFKGSIDDFMKLNIQRGNYMMQLKGSNGTATPMSALQSQKLINANAKKNIFGNDNDDNEQVNQGAEQQISSFSGVPNE